MEKEESNKKINQNKTTKTSKKTKVNNSNSAKEKNKETKTTTNTKEKKSNSKNAKEKKSSSANTKLKKVETTINNSKVDNSKNIKTNKNEKKSTSSKEENLVLQVENSEEDEKALKKVEKKDLKKAELDTIKKEIKNNKKTKTLSLKKQKKLKKIFLNLLIAIFSVIYYLILIIGLKNINIIQYITDLKVAVILEAIITVILFENAAKKDNNTFTIFGIEIFIIGIETVFLIQFVGKQSIITNQVIAIMTVICTLYYLIKVLIISLRKKV